MVAIAVYIFHRVVLAFMASKQGLKLVKNLKVALILQDKDNRTIMTAFIFIKNIY